MQVNLREYLQDGANEQAQAVLALVKYLWSEDNDEHIDTEARVGRWENCREQGYVISIKGGIGLEQVNIAFFEHRNSDVICAIKWHQSTINTPTIDVAENIDFNGEVYQEDKYDVSRSVGFGKVKEMAEWIVDELEKYVELVRNGNPQTQNKEH